MDVDASLTILGGFGLVQGLNFLVYLFCSGSSGWLLTGVSFTIGEPEGYRCSLPPNGTWDGASFVAEECKLIELGESGDSSSNVTTACLYGWDYDSVHGETSSVTDLNLVCDRYILMGTLTSIHFGGALAGSYVLGQISDLFGRRLVVLGSVIAAVITGTGLSFTWDFGMMCALRFFNGACIPGMLTVAYVREIEMFTPNRRVRAQLMSEMAWVIGISLLAPMAYLMPDWRHFQLTISLLCLPLIPMVWFSFESIRWLVQKGRVDEAEKILQRIAKSKNIYHVGYFLLAQRDPDVQNRNAPLNGNAIELETKPSREADGWDPEKPPLEDLDSPTYFAESRRQSPSTKKATLLDLFKTPALVFRTLFVFFCWFASSVVYYGFFINAGNLVGNKYLNFFLISLTEAPCYVINYFVMTKLGRRRPLIFYYFASGVACVVTGVIPPKSADGSDLTVVILVIAMIGKFFATTAFDILYLVTAELYPTTLRSAAVGAASMVSRMGGMVAPFIIYLNVIHSSLPMIVFGVVSILAGVFVLPFPETSNRSLPEILEDGAKLTTKEPAKDEASPVQV
ncbi:organic cation transporter protein-like [Acanthaster planci]|uniref:Organic cation transporter protein-like n=1 Tax=Acanthaster planci TaxID=133434 RepID=A0A8B7XH09_ACAPL|nr:organic cation transporter protein-like [Acanthaster planci]